MKRIHLFEDFDPEFLRMKVRDSLISFSEGKQDAIVNNETYTEEKEDMTESGSKSFTFQFEVVYTYKGKEYSVSFNDVYVTFNLSVDNSGDYWTPSGSDEIEKLKAEIMDDSITAFDDEGDEYKFKLGEMGDLFKKRMTSYFREYFINNDDVFYS
jgi:hypothetical protein